MGSDLKFECKIFKFETRSQNSSIRKSFTISSKKTLSEYKRQNPLGMHGMPVSQNIKNRSRQTQTCVSDHQKSELKCLCLKTLKNRSRQTQTSVSDQ